MRYMGKNLLLLMVAILCVIFNGLLVRYTSSQSLRLPVFDNEFIQILALLLVRWGGWAGVSLGIVGALVHANLKQIALSLLLMIVGSSVCGCGIGDCGTLEHFFGGLLMYSLIYSIGLAFGVAAGFFIREYF